MQTIDAKKIRTEKRAQPGEDMLQAKNTNKYQKTLKPLRHMGLEIDRWSSTLEIGHRGEGKGI